MKESSLFNPTGAPRARSDESLRPIDISIEDEHEFFIAVQDYKAQSGRLFPTCSELLEVLKALGYEKRIWKPVETWSALPAQSRFDEALCRESPTMLGWFSTVETPLAP